MNVLFHNKNQSTEYPEIHCWEGKELGDCIIDSCIGVGESGEVYKGYIDGSPVAIKILADKWVNDEVQFQRFCRETKVLKKIEHPNIIKFLKMDKSIDVHFIVMEYFSGINLSQVLADRKRIPMREAVNIIFQICQGMKIVHNLNLIHRDLKPANILYDSKNKQIKIIDFGIARSLIADQSITQPGFLLGTFAYMSPEQSRILPLDRRSDIYSLGAVFYHLLTGKIPFYKSTPLQTLLAHVMEPITWPSFLSIADSLKKIIEKMMAKSPEQRYSSMKEVIQDLSNFLNKL